MFCNQCGRNIPENSNICPYCGNKIKKESNPSQNNTSPPQIKQKKKHKFLPVIIIIIAAIIIVPVIFLLGDSNSDSEKTNNPIIAPALSPSEEALAIAKERNEEFYIERERSADFARRAFANDITFDMMNRDPSRYEGKEIYIGGEVLQALYDSDDPLKVQLRIGNSYNYYSDVMYVFYTLDKNEPRIIEGDYADIYGYFDGLITYESIMGENITIPSMRAEYLYNYPADGGGAYPEYEHADDLIRGVFVSEDGTEMSFPKNQSPDYYYFEHVEEYDDCLLVLYYPESALWGTDHPPLYHLIVFDDGRLVAFRENKTASSAHDGTYTYYEKTDAPAYTENPSDYAGTWESGRCHMDVTNSLGIYYVEINWASSASENTRYSFECTFDPESGCLTYVDGICCNEYYPDNGEMAETIVYSDGSGFFYVEDGYMYWEDSYGESLIFSKPY